MTRLVPKALHRQSVVLCAQHAIVLSARAVASNPLHVRRRLHSCTLSRLPLPFTVKTMTVYAIAQLKFTDRAAYDRYQEAFMEIFQQYSGRLLAADESPRVVEGSW